MVLYWYKFSKFSVTPDAIVAKEQALRELAIKVPSEEFMVVDFKSGIRF